MGTLHTEPVASVQRVWLLASQMSGPQRPRVEPARGSQVPFNSCWRRVVSEAEQPWRPWLADNCVIWAQPAKNIERQDVAGWRLYECGQLTLLQKKKDVFKTSHYFITTLNGWKFPNGLSKISSCFTPANVEKLPLTVVFSMAALCSCHEIAESCIRKSRISCFVTTNAAQIRSWCLVK